MGFDLVLQVKDILHPGSHIFVKSLSLPATVVVNGIQGPVKCSLDLRPVLFVYHILLLDGHDIRETQYGGKDFVVHAVGFGDRTHCKTWEILTNPADLIIIILHDRSIHQFGRFCRGRFEIDVDIDGSPHQALRNLLPDCEILVLGEKGGFDADVRALRIERTYFDCQFAGNQIDLRLAVACHGFNHNKVDYYAQK